jgi:hypothetical protein
MLLYFFKLSVKVVHVKCLFPNHVCVSVIFSGNVCVHVYALKVVFWNNYEKI